MALSQSERNKKWRQKNKERQTYLVHRSVTRNFIKKEAQAADLDEIDQLSTDRRKTLKKEEKP